MKPLDRKLVRDLWRLRGQVFTIALVVASGLGGFLGSFSAHSSLVALRDAYYERGRFAHVFVECKRAPAELIERVRTFAGVVDVQATVIGNVLITLPGVTAPMSGRVVAVPVSGPPAINRVVLQSGNWLEPHDHKGVLLSEAFATARGIAPGDSLSVLMNGRFETVTVRGIALSPEFIFAAAAGGFSDDSRFGVLWLSREKLEAAYDMKGAFNQLTLRLSRDASVPDIIARLDRLLEPYGTTGAYGRENQLSHRTLTQEINEQRVFGTVLPAVFLAVAVFLLNVLVSRHILTERSQIAALKALGYSNLAIGAHFLKLVLAIVALGIALGVVIGVAFGRWMTGLYTAFFHFPSEDYHLALWLVLLGSALAILAGVVAVANAVHAVVKLPPAEAMRPPSPASFHRTLLDRLGIGRVYSPAARMVVREMERRPLRAVLTSVGVASSVAIVVAGTCWSDSFDYLVELEFGVRERPDVMLALAEPVGAGVQHELAHLPGVLKAEASRDVPAQISHGASEARVSIIGLEPEAQLRRALDSHLTPIPIERGGLIITRILSEKLGARPGDRLWVDPLQGSQPARLVPVTAIAGDYMGTIAYMDRRDAAQLAGEDETFTSARLRVDRKRLDELFARLREMPRIAAVGDKLQMLEHFRETSGRNLLFFTAILSVFAACIAVGVVYNSARISLAEHAWELATLRVLGFTRAEVSKMLFGQIGVQTLIAIPAGFVFGYALSALIVALIHGEEFRIPLVILPKTYAYAALVMLGAGLMSALIVRRRIDELDLIGVLKTRE